MGKKKFKIAPQAPSSALSSKIPSDPKAPINDARPCFAFGSFDEDHARYSSDAIKDSAEWRLLFKHLKAMASQTWGQIKQAHQFHAHEINWKDTSEPNGFAHLSASLREFPAFQFKAFKEGRVVGFFMFGVFQVVWFDREHAVYPGR